VQTGVPIDFSRLPAVEFNSRCLPTVWVAKLRCTTARVSSSPSCSGARDEPDLKIEAERQRLAFQGIQCRTTLGGIE
jgi:hypothetical protein